MREGFKAGGGEQQQRKERKRTEQHATSCAARAHSRSRGCQPFQSAPPSCSEVLEAVGRLSPRVAQAAGIQYVDWVQGDCVRISPCNSLRPSWLRTESAPLSSLKPTLRTHCRLTTPPPPWFRSQVSGAAGIWNRNSNLHQMHEPVLLLWSLIDTALCCT